MNQYKELEVVMLATLQEAPIYKFTLNNKIRNSKAITLGTDDEYQHLYFLSNDEIKEGDWAYHTLDSKPIQVTELPHPTVDAREYGHKKIIATTDESLGLHKPSDEWIEYFIFEYNKGNIITKVEVEYEKESYSGRFTQNTVENWGKRYNLKINPDNTINIKSVKETWNDIYNKFSEYCIENDWDNSNGSYIVWLKENYQVPKQLK